MCTCVCVCVAFYSLESGESFWGGLLHFLRFLFLFSFFPYCFLPPDEVDGNAPVTNLYNSDASFGLFSLSMRRTVATKNDAVDVMRIHGIDGILIANHLSANALRDPAVVSGKRPYSDYFMTKVRAHAARFIVEGLVAARLPPPKALVWPSLSAAAVAASLR